MSSAIEPSDVSISAIAPAKPRLLGLDLLRLAAVVLVLGRHMRLPPETWSPTWQAIFAAWHRGGWVGVDLFFVLSGFLVSGLLFSEFQQRKQISLGRFFTRRGWKIYPPFLVLIAAMVLMYYLIKRPLPLHLLLNELFFLQNYRGGLWNHTWSLAVEEHFYLLLPSLFILLVRFRQNAANPLSLVPALTAAVAVILLTWRFANLYFRPAFTYETHLFASHLRLDSLFFGVAISYAYHFHYAQFIATCSPWRSWLLIGGSLLLVPAFVYPMETTPFIYTVGFTLFYLGSGMLLVGALLSKLPHNPLTHGLGFLGRSSYSIYLWHMPVLVWGLPLFEKYRGSPLGYEVRTMYYLIGSLVVGVLMAQLIETPILRLRDRWFPSGPVNPR